jgi:hypothetical protein
MTLEEILQWWSFVFLGVLVYSIGEQTKRVFPRLATKPWYQRTIVFHAPVQSVIIAATPWFPMPAAIGDEIGTRILFGLVAGISCSWSYKAFMRLLGKDNKSQVSTEVVEETKP